MFLKFNGSESRHLKIKTTARKIQFHLRQLCYFPLFFYGEIVEKSFNGKHAVPFLGGSQIQNSMQCFNFCERFEPRSHFKRLSFIVRVNVVLNRTVVVDSD